MPTVATGDIPLEHWPANAKLAFLLDDGSGPVELVITDDGHAVLGEQKFAVVDQIRVAERRACLAALLAGRI